MEKQVSSEEKLLKLIRKGDDQKRKEKEESGKGKKSSLNNKKDAQKEIGRVDFFKIANRLLLIVSVGLAGYLITNYSFKQESILPMLSINRVEFVQNVELTEILFPEPKPFIDYEQQLAQRNMFQAPWEKPKEKKKEVKSNISELSKLYKIVGIVLDDNPMVIIEELRTKQTLFLSKGEIINDAEVIDIFEDRVIFSYLGKEIELTP